MNPLQAHHYHPQIPRHHGATTLCSSNRWGDGARPVSTNGKTPTCEQAVGGACSTGNFQPSTFQLSTISYFGARYYENDLSIWLSVDPLSDKYPVITSYNYCFNNPIIVKDPDGRDGILIVFPDYEADRYENTGHAGILLISKTGVTKYYEYGRYDTDKDEVKHYSISNVTIGDDGRPTIESLDIVLEEISKESGNSQRIKEAYFKSEKCEDMKKYAQTLYEVRKDENRKPYSILTNNCGTFADDVVNIDKELDTPSIIDPRPVSIIEKYQNKFTPVHYNPKKEHRTEKILKIRFSIKNNRN